MRFRPVHAVFALAAFLSACDRTPSDPTDGALELAAMLLDHTVGGAADPPYSLSSLLQSAIQRVYREQGAHTARSLVRDLRGAQDNARARTDAGAGQTATAHTRAIEAAEIQIILRVFGDDIAAAVVASVRDDALRLRADADSLSTSGRPMARTLQLLADADELLFDAASALNQNAAHAALDLGTRAGTATAGARAAVIDATRVLTLDRLFADAKAKQDDSLRDAFRNHEQLSLSARVAVTAGNREMAQKALEAVRASEVQIVLRSFGNDVTTTLLDDAAAALHETGAALDRDRAGERNVVRLTRMHAAAGDLIARANIAARRADFASALDLASHAAGLLNSIRAAL